MDFIKEQPKVTTMMTAIKTGKTIRLWNKTTAIPLQKHPRSTTAGKQPRNCSFSSCQKSPTFSSRNQPPNFSKFSCQGKGQHETPNLGGKTAWFINNCLKCE